MRARPAIDKPLAKYRCGVKNNLRHLIRLQLTVAAVGRDDAWRFSLVGHLFKPSPLREPLRRQNPYRFLPPNPKKLGQNTWACFGIDAWLATPSS